ncbi:MAG: hypothetical protein JWQ11_2567 [Rhizobacter sp.]|nr:hypothetical protein [Rhizobacter sp.]
MKLFTVAALALFATAPAFAIAPAFTVDFEKSWDYLDGSVAGYYAGGTAADGTSGADLGVSFSGMSGLSNDAAFTYYSGAPSAQGVAYVYDTSFMNVAAGVQSTLSFYYSSATSVLGAVKAYSGLNGTGNLLGSFDLAANTSGGYDSWTAATFAFNGVAASFDLSSSVDAVAFDNISHVSPVPEPSTYALMLLGGGLLVGARRFRRGSGSQG